ncbi:MULTISPECIES: hypothetical protein [Elizabethkingia]|uniref:hypothetical protein n=1 Tax=Elizabethkingia TaxID=308865 RepID=UPI0021A7C3E4|nr:hypothetical protein [Elizabethkingia sp. HX CGY]MCT3689561.1 hypothetical protein [Elizabethkingia anophelis]MCT3706351.1 hypothetical protein [Elizabethkingia anophelis]MCT3713369.1 hypothetical protein [Elizabethkingia anophelis]MCT3716787.1 hypothetical protein [Elizabethkingia anophelis]MCT3730454.1 hypothetical protein [Elizabethkingia anophelis]
MTTYIILENGIKTISKVLAPNSEAALLKANELNAKHKMYTGVLSVEKVFNL